MLSIKNLTGAGGPGAVVGYLEHRREASGATGYYEGAGGAPSFWHGRGSAALGLAGPVDGQELEALLSGQVAGQDLSERGGAGAARRLGVDLTFSAPKSISIVALAGGDERFKAAHDAAVRAALDFIEKEVVTARMGKGGSKGAERTGNLVAGVYRHEDSRPVDGRVDPQLHSHCCVVNATQRADGTWVALDLQFGEGSVLMHTADAIYKNELARAAQHMGYAIRRTADGFELAGITDEQIKNFSARAAQVDEALAARGLTRDTASATERAAACLATREGKHQVARTDQAWDWRRRAREMGVNVEPQGQAAPADLTHEAVTAAVRHVGERETVFDRNAVRLEALRAGMGSATLESITSSMDEGAAGLIDVGGSNFTTRDALTREQTILARVRAGQGQARPLMTPHAAASFIQHREAAQGFALTDGQRAALALTLTSQDGVNVIVGAAGAGKTTAMAAAVAAHREAGFEVVGVGPSAKARDELAGAGADTNHTLAAWLAKDHEHNDNRLIILDEAGMVSASDMDKILQKLEREGGRLLLVGDPQQLAAVEAGSPMAQIIQTRVAAVARIDEIQRQRDAQLRAVAQAFADGKAAEAVKAARPYMQAAAIEAKGPAKPTTEERRAAIAQDTAQVYLSLSPEERGRTLVLSGTNAVREQVNARIRKAMQARGEAAHDEIQITALHKADLTRERQARAESYTPGMVVRLRQGRETTDYIVARTQGERVILRDADGTEKRWNPVREKAQGVYEARAMSLAAGDEILFRENQRIGDQKITNGQSGRVTSTADNSVTVTLSDGREIVLDPGRGHALDYGWCRTIHASQGATVDRVIVAGEASRVATAESAYVACSRARDELQIITDNPDRLEKSWGKWAERQTALEAAHTDETTDLPALASARAEAAAELGEAGDLAVARDQAARAQHTTELEME
ncbi:MobF family relaxase [Acidiferrobacter sp.]|uniref:MobF family relaxase n=1 Tax=Acidiferrobacter sp. TaxID=1872107 RepID=UPI00262D4176|nr:MobF family relaxase [Acidiferrobacter sp.]